MDEAVASLKIRGSCLPPIIPPLCTEDAESPATSSGTSRSTDPLLMTVVGFKMVATRRWIVPIGGSGAADR